MRGSQAFSPIMWALLISLSLCSAAAAQQEIPGDISDTPPNQTDQPSTSPSDSYARSLREPRDQEIVLPHRHISKMFWLRWGAVLALTVASTELTQHCEHEKYPCGEGNPIFGSHPGRARMYGIKLGLLGTLFYYNRKDALRGRSDWKYESFVLLPILAADTSWDAYMNVARPRLRPAPSALILNAPTSQVEPISPGNVGSKR
jgi:hypothetical protein